MPKNREQRLLSDLAAMEADFLHGKTRFEDFLDRWATTIADIQTALADDFLSDFAVQCISDTFSTVLAPAAIVHQAISQAESAIVDDVANALEDLALFVPDDNTEFVDDLEPPNHLQDWLLANVHYPFIPDALDPAFLKHLDMTEDSFSSWLSQAREEIGWNRLAAEFANKDPHTMQKLCHIVFDGVSSTSISLNKTAQLAQSQILKMKTEIENFCQPPMAAWMEEAQRRIQDIKMRPDILWDDYDEWEDEEDSLFESDEESTSEGEVLFAPLIPPTQLKRLEEFTKPSVIGGSLPESAPMTIKETEAKSKELKSTNDVDSTKLVHASLSEDTLICRPSQGVRFTYVGSKRKLDELLRKDTSLSSFRKRIHGLGQKQTELSHDDIALPTISSMLDSDSTAHPVKRRRHDSPVLVGNNNTVRGISMAETSCTQPAALLDVPSPTSSYAASPASSSGSESGSPYNPLPSPTNSPSPPTTRSIAYPPSPINSVCTTLHPETASLPAPVISTASPGTIVSSSIPHSFRQGHHNTPTNSSLDTLSSHTLQHQSPQDSKTSVVIPHHEPSVFQQKYSTSQQAAKSSPVPTSLLMTRSLQALNTNVQGSQSPDILKVLYALASSDQVQITSQHQFESDIKIQVSSKPPQSKPLTHRKRKREEAPPKIEKFGAVFRESSNIPEMTLPHQLDKRHPRYQYKSRKSDGKPNKTLVFPSGPSPSTSQLSPSVLEALLDHRPFKRSKQFHSDDCLG